MTASPYKLDESSATESQDSMLTAPRCTPWARGLADAYEGLEDTGENCGAEDCG
jgi:hypothetical protein